MPARLDQPISFDDAVERLSAAHLELAPAYLACGRIRGAIGCYRLAEDGKGRQALLFAFDPEDLAGPTPPAPERLFVVEAHDRRTLRPWVYHAMVAHQARLTEALLHHGTLYQVGPDAWKSSAVSYRLFPDGKDLWKVRLYSSSEYEANGVEVGEKPPEGVFGRPFALGKGKMDRAAAERLVAADFFARVRRAGLGLDPLTGSDIRRNPFWLPIRAMQRTLGYFRGTSRWAVLKDFGMFGLAILKGPLKVAMRLGGSVVKYGVSLYKRYYARERDITGALTRKVNTESAFGAALRPAETGALAGFRLLTENEARVRPANAPLLGELDESWAHDWILCSFQGPAGSVVRPRNNGVIEVRQANGVIVDYMADRRLAWARASSADAQPDATPVPERVARLLRAHQVVEAKMDEAGRRQGRGLTLAEFRANLTDITGDANWHADTPGAAVGVDERTGRQFCLARAAALDCPPGPVRRTRRPGKPVNLGR